MLKIITKEHPERDVPLIKAKFTSQDRYKSVPFSILFFSYEYVPGVSKKYPLLTGNRKEAIRYHYSPSS